LFEKLVRYLNGYVKVVLVGNSPERFINLCRNNNIYTWNHCVKNNRYYMNMKKNDYKKVHSIYRKTHTYPHIISKKGFPFILWNVIRKKTVIPSWIVFFGMIILLSKFVWNIEITGEKRYTDEELGEYLNGIGIKKYMLIDDVNGAYVETNIRNKYNDISWVSSSLTGCNMYIKIIESDIMEDKSNGNMDCSSIVASSDGYVHSIVTRRGTPLVKPDDIVKKGQVLVSGVINISSDSGEVVKKNPVYADADIYVNTEYTYRDSFEMIYPTKQYSGRKKQYIRLKIKDGLFFLQNPLNRFKSFEKYDIIKSNYEQGVLWSVTVVSEYETIYKTYSKEEAVNKARNNLLIYMNNLRDKGVVIGEKSITSTIKNGVCLTQGVISVKEPQINRQPLSDEELSKDDLTEYGRKVN